MTFPSRLQVNFKIETVGSHFAVFRFFPIGRNVVGKNSISSRNHLFSSDWLMSVRISAVDKTQNYGTNYYTVNEILLVQQILGNINASDFWIRQYSSIAIQVLNLFVALRK